MSVPPEFFDRISGQVNLPLLQGQLVVIVGIGTVGSQMARELANSGVGRLRLIDGDPLEESNLARHVLPRRFVGENKAESLALYLAEEVPGSRTEAVPEYVDDAMSDGQLDKLLEDADLIVAATDDREAQRRIGRRALALDIPAIFPALFADEGGEVFVQQSPRLPCFLCWDAHRPVNQQLRAVQALNADTLALVQLAIHLSLACLDRGSGYARLLDTPSTGNPPQLFRQNRFALAIRPVDRRPGCPSCNVGPADGQWSTPPTPAAPVVPPPVASSTPAPVVPPPVRPRPAPLPSLDDVGDFAIRVIVGLFLWCLGVYMVMSLLFALAGASLDKSSVGIKITIALYIAPVAVGIVLGLENWFRRR